MKRMTLLLFLLALPAWATNYTTNFPTNENPISENGNWLNGSTNSGGRWDNVQTVNGVAQDTAVQSTSGNHNYDDALAILTGVWGANQTACGTVYINPGWSGRNSGTHEVEIHLRSALSSGNASGYEINYSVETDANRYAQIVRWNGPGGNFTGIASVLPPVLNNGDVICATIAGTTITATRNGTAFLTTTDSVFSSGAPGMGFWNNYAMSDNAQFGFSSFTAKDDGSGGSGGGNPPPAQAVLTGTPVSTSQIALAWTADPNPPTAYYVERCKGAGCTNFSWVSTIAGTSYNDAKLAAATSYRYYAGELRGGKYSQYTNIASATTLSTTPTSPVATLSASESSIVVGSPVTLTWSSTNATSASLAPSIGGVATTGSMTLNPSVTTTYTLTVSGPGGTAQATVTVTVMPACTT